MVLGPLVRRHQSLTRERLARRQGWDVLPLTRDLLHLGEYLACPIGWDHCKCGNLQFLLPADAGEV
jgi:hypothetical protein